MLLTHLCVVAFMQEGFNHQRKKKAWFDSIEGRLSPKFQPQITCLQCVAVLKASIAFCRLATCVDLERAQLSAQV